MWMSESPVCTLLSITAYMYLTAIHAQSREASMILKLLCTLLVVNNEHEYRTGVCSL